jgi:hypothetical protein
VGILVKGEFMNILMRSMLYVAVVTGGLMLGNQLSAFYGEQPSYGVIYDGVVAFHYNPTLESFNNLRNTIASLLNADPSGENLSKAINQQDSNGNTPLHIAAMQAATTPNSTNLINLLLNNGARKDIPNNNGDYPGAVATGPAWQLLQ